MLFNSYPFLLGFFPLTLLGYYLCARYFGATVGWAALVAASLFFYAYWDVRFLPLILGSILVNYAAAISIAAALARRRARAADFVLAAAITANLLTLAAFKYSHFLADNINSLLDTKIAIGAVILPLGISFFTFEQIGFLVDTRRENTHPGGLIRYALFVSLFSRLVAGPILRFNEIAPQLDRRGPPKSAYSDLAIGLTIFFIGLVKKAFLADSIAPYANQVFASAAEGNPIDLFMAWGGALAYTCQLYFDFSGYSDMAIGAARCFGIRFPMNFFSPYKATSIIEFWRRWHMTLSRFLRDYLYFSLGGNRRGPIRRYVNLLITMLLGGLWHGASWTFVFWGGLHGVYLVANHAWITMCRKNSVLGRFRLSRSGAGFGFVLTFTSVVVAWVFFRAPSFGVALDILGGMAGRHGAMLPSGFAFALTPVQHLLDQIGIGVDNGSGTQFVKTYLWDAALLSIALLLPNTQEILARGEPVLEMSGDTKFAAPPWWGWRIFPRWAPIPVWAALSGALAFLGMISITRVSEFLYWQF